MINRDVGLCNLLAIGKTGGVRTFTAGIFGGSSKVSQNPKHINTDPGVIQVQFVLSVFA
jgi:hypothetical protein